MAGVPLGAVRGIDRLLSQASKLNNADVAEYRSWLFVLRAVMGILAQDYVNDLRIIEALPANQVPIDVPDAVLEPNANRRCQDVYFALVLTTGGEIQVMVQQEDAHANGYEAYRLIVQACDPRVRRVVCLAGTLDRAYRHSRAPNSRLS